MSGVVLAVVCVLAPAGWGALMYVVFGWLQRRRRTDVRSDGLPTDYTI